MKNKLILPALILLSAFLFSFSFPNLVFSEGLWPLAWICFLPLFFASERISLKNSFWWGLFYGILCYGVLVFWLINYSPAIFIIAVLFCSILTALLFVCLKITVLAFPNNGWFVQCLLIVSFEFLKTLGFFGFSYGVTGYTQYKKLGLIGVSRLTGVHGVSAFLILFSGILYAFVKAVFAKREQSKSNVLQKHRNVWLFPVTVSSFYIICLFSVLLYGKYGKNIPEAEKYVQVLSVQHNENSRENGVDVYAREITVLTQLTNEGLSLYPETEMVVWPETAVTPSIMYQYYNGKDSRRISIVKSLLKYFESKSCMFVTGNFYARAKPGTNVTDDYNSALVFVPGENVIPPVPYEYYKQRLVPLSEEFPFEKHFLNIKKYLEGMGANYWKKGDKNVIFTHNSGLKFSTPICFEDTFPDICRSMYLDGSRCFINLTNDSWGKSEACQNQHLAMAVFRSVENHVPSVRSATSGQTCYISPEGKVEKCLEPFTASYLLCNVPVFREKLDCSFFTKHGNIFAWAAFAITCILLILSCIKCIIKKWQK